MKNKTIKTNHYTVVITDSKNEILSKHHDKNETTVSLLIEAGDGKVTIYLNSDYYNTQEALKYGAAQNILKYEMENIMNQSTVTEEKIDLRSQVIGTELVDILKQL